MAWQRSGDNGATYPKLLDVIGCDTADDRSVNEVGGFIWRCSLQSAGHDTNYLISKGTAFLVGGSRARLLLDQAVEVGLLQQVLDVEGKTAWKLIDDPAFIHLRTKAEIDWENQRKRDNSNPALCAPARKRDGDGCRYCGTLTIWSSDRRSARAGTYDHVIPGKPATLATFVVACGTCNRERSNNPDANETHPLRPPPAEPFYSDATVTYLANNGFVVTPSDPRPGTPYPATARPASKVDPAPVDLAPTETPTPPANEPSPDAATTDLQIDPDTTYPEPGFTGSGRDGSGRAGTGRDGPGREGTGRAGRSRRGRRSPRGRKPGVT